MDNSVSAVTSYELDGLDLIPCIARLFSTASRQNLGPIQPPIQWVLGALIFVAKLKRCEARHSPPSSAEFKNSEAIPLLPNTSSRHCA
jgi:hypothetical protein